MVNLAIALALETAESVRVLFKVHSIDVLACPRCGSRMPVIAVITDPAQIRKATGAAQGIIDCLDRHGRGPPPLG